MGIQSSLTFTSQQTSSDATESAFCLDLNVCTLQEALQQLMIDGQAEIPFIVWLFENPGSPIALPGNIDLYGHDCMHALLNRFSQSLADEAFVIGFTMGNDYRSNWLHKLLFKVISSSVYPKKYRFSWKDFQSFDAGFAYGRTIQVKNLNQINLKVYESETLTRLRQRFGMCEQPT